jgi:hypothetical protein
MIPARVKAELAAALAEYQASQRKPRPTGNWFTCREIAASWGLSRVQTSRILAAMRRAGKAEHRKVGRAAYYKVTP